MVIRTGLKTLTLKVKRKGLIEYRCTKCGRQNLDALIFETTKTATFHAFGGDQGEKKAEIEANRKAAEDLQKRDDELFKAINLNRDYGAIHSPIVCPACGEKQLWSVIPKPWKTVKWFGAWVVGLICFGISTLGFALTAGVEGLPAFLVPLFVLISLPMIRTCKRKKALRKLQEISFQPPKYYNRSNVHERSSV